MIMAPNHGFLIQNNMTEPVSRTYQYRKVMKPMLERKRRARINRCLDELKELMTGALQTEGENVAKLEKADILELTVRHLHILRRQNQLATRPEHSYADRFRAGFRHCAVEVNNFLSGLDPPTKSHLTSHLSGCIRRLENYSSSPSIEEQPQPNPQLISNRNLAQHHFQAAHSRPGFFVPSSNQHQVVPESGNMHRLSLPPPSPQNLRRSVSPPNSPNSNISGNSEENVWRPW